MSAQDKASAVYIVHRAHEILLNKYKNSLYLDLHVDSRVVFVMYTEQTVVTKCSYSFFAPMQLAEQLSGFFFFLFFFLWAE